MVRFIGAVLGALLLVAAGRSADAAAAPIKIGFSVEETGGSAASGRQFLLTAQIWAKDVNKAGGLLGRPVELVYYDDQSNPALVPGIYTKLLDVDKVDLIIASGTNYSAAAMPFLMGHKETVLDTLALAVNDEFHYPRFFQTMPYGPHGKEAISAGYFAAAMTIKPRPKTIALTGADAEFSLHALQGAREQIKKLGLKIVYDRTYPPDEIDFSPILASIRAVDPDLVFVASYPQDTAGILRALQEQGLKAKMFGGPLIGLQYGSIKEQMGPRLNGIVDYELYVHEKTMKFPGTAAFITQYQAAAKTAGTDPLGYYVPPLVYATFQVLQQAVAGTGSLDQEKLAQYMHKATFKTVIGDIAFGADGEWKNPRILTIQYQNVHGHGLAQFEKDGTQVILAPAAVKTGTLKYPFAAASE